MGRSFFVPELISGGDSEIRDRRRQPNPSGPRRSRPDGARCFFSHALPQCYFFPSAGLKGLILASFCLLAGCVDNEVAAQAPPPPRPQATNLDRRPGVSPSGAAVAIVSFAGGPDGLRESFSQAFDTAARTQDIVMATPAAANYLVRGYLNAVPEGDGTALTYVLDIFDAKKHRTQRVEDQILLKAQATDPWSVVDDSALSAIAAKSAAALAAVLTNTPEAILAASEAPPANAPAVVTTHAIEDGRTVVTATPPASPPTAAASEGDLRRVALH